ncbi:MAG: hypothetical protein K2J80_01445 [Oscillospiraceae bacterium]|nr:hypothetical protein [Oscillospiraceae bacterium]
MIKRIVVLLAAVLLPVALIFTGCGSKQLTAQEYFDELSACYKEYSAAFKELSPIIEMANDVASAKSNSAKVKDICGRVNKALSKFEKLNPPSQFSAQQKKLVTSIANERKFVKAAENLFAADTLDGLLSARNELQATQDLPEDQQFLTIFLQLIKDVKSVL